MSLRFFDFGATISAKYEYVKSTIKKTRRTTACFSDLQRESSIEADDDEDEEMGAITQFRQLRRTNYLCSKSILNVMSTLCLCLVSTAPSMI